MSEDTNEGVTKPRANIIEVPLVGEPSTDKAFRNLDDGLTYRVRIIFETGLQDVPSGTSSTLITTGNITVTRINEDGSVVKDANGLAINVADPTRITLDNAALSAKDGETVEQIIQRTLEEVLYEASKMTDGQQALGTILSSWGAVPSIAAAVTTPLEPIEALGPLNLLDDPTMPS